MNPQGYDRLVKSTDSFKGQLGMDIDTALAIIKDMAKALTMTTDYCPGDCKQGEKSYIYGHDEARDALKKFKEWK